MAELLFPNGTNITVYDTGSGVFAASFAHGGLSFIESTAPLFEFDTTEPVGVFEYGYISSSATYAGTVSYGGETYPVFNHSNGQTIVWGVSLPTVDFPNIASLNLDTSNYLFCFHAGTRIATPTGEVTVEALSIGNPVRLADGRTVPVKWIGRQTVSTRFGPAERLMPVRFAAGSLGDGLPHTDLTVTADHGMLVEGVICHAGALVNGTTITRVPLAEMGQTYTVYHIETEEHEIILANGAPAETFIDNVSRRAFDNYAEFDALYGEVPEMQELPYPRAMSARQVPFRILSKLSAEAAA